MLNYPTTQETLFAASSKLQANAKAASGLELVVTTPGHPFYLSKNFDATQRPAPEGRDGLGKNWVGAGDLKPGDKIRQSDGTLGTVVMVKTVLETRTMYNLDVAVADTFYVGDGQWLVHNAGCDLWKPTKFSGKKVYQRNDLIDPNLVDGKGRTNIQRMEQGLAPIGSDGKSINLHHTTQMDDGPVAEVTSTFHYENYRVIHINPNTIPSGIDRDAFNAWKRDYWKARATDFKP